MICLTTKKNSIYLLAMKLHITQSTDSKILPYWLKSKQQKKNKGTGGIRKRNLAKTEQTA